MIYCEVRPPTKNGEQNMKAYFTQATVTTTDSIKRYSFCTEARSACTAFRATQEALRQNFPKAHIVINKIEVIEEVLEHFNK